MINSSDFISPTLLYKSDVIQDTVITVDDKTVYVFARVKHPTVEEIILISSDDSGDTWVDPIVLVNSTDRHFDNLIVVNMDNSTLFVYYLLLDDNGDASIGSLMYLSGEKSWLDLSEKSVDSILKNQNYGEIELLGSDQVLSLVWYSTKQMQIATSLDQGQTWTTSTLLKYDVIYDWRFSTVISLEDGTIVLTAVGTQKSYPATCNSIPAILVVFRSGDDGKTWSSLNIASFATFPCCGDVKEINPVLATNRINEIDLLFFGNSSSESSCAILFTSSNNNSGETWSRAVSLSSDYLQTFIDPSLATYSLDEVQLYWIDIGAALWRKFSNDGGNTWTATEAVTQALVTENIELSSSHLALIVDNFDQAHLVFSVFTQTNTTECGTIYYVKQTSLRHWYLKPLALGLWITTVIITISLVAGWFILAKWRQNPPQTYDTY